MSGAVTADPREKLFDAIAVEPTLDDLLIDVWEGLAADRVVGCPVCGGEMLAEHSSAAAGLAGRCTGCGSTLH